MRCGSRRHPLAQSMKNGLSAISALWWRNQPIASSARSAPPLEPAMRVEDGIEQAGRVDRLQLTAAPSSIGDSAPPDDSYRGNESPRQTVEQRLKVNNAARDLI